MNSTTTENYRQHFERLAVRLREDLANLGESFIASASLTDITSEAKGWFVALVCEDKEAIVQAAREQMVAA